MGTLHLAVKKFLWRGVCYQQLLVKNYATAPVETAISLHFEADFADIFEVRGMKRKAHGQDCRLKWPTTASSSAITGWTTWSAAR